MQNVPYVLKRCVDMSFYTTGLITVMVDWIGDKFGSRNGHHHTDTLTFQVGVVYL